MFYDGALVSTGRLLAIVLDMLKRKVQLRSKVQIYVLRSQHENRKQLLLMYYHYVIERLKMVDLRRDDDDGSIVSFLPPPLHHVHQLDQRIGRGRDLVTARPAHQLEQLTRF